MDEFQQIMQHIHNGDNFLLSGGAGSGKTYSLVQVIKKVIEENPTSPIACMTYTNAAVKEIEERVNHNNLNVTTIHEFLWDNVKHYQKEIKKALVELINDPDNKKFQTTETLPLPDDYFKDDIEYSYLSTNLSIGRISHEEVILLSNYLFKKHRKLCDILKDKYKFIFIDEYQDTHKEVVEIFLEHLKQSAKYNIIGFFGDSMQAIYPEGVGNIETYIEAGEIKEVVKKQNRRNPQLVINLANALRTDSVQQEPSEDLFAPNMKDGQVKQGKIHFYHSRNKEDLNKLKSDILGWSFEFDEHTRKIQSKELNLTHNLIAEKAGFETLMNIYDKEPIVALKKDILEKIKKGSTVQIEDEDTFDVVVDKFQPKNQARILKKEIILQDHILRDLYSELKDQPFSVVRKIFINKDQLIDDKKQDEGDENKKGGRRDDLIKHLHNIQQVIELYKNGEYNEFLKHTAKRITSVSEKLQLKSDIDDLINVGDKTIEKVIEEANEKGICLIGDKLIKFKLEKKYIYNRIKDVKFKEFQNLYEYLEGKTPFSTQHKTKGTEFNNVLVIVDNGNWSDYNFEYLFDEKNQFQKLIDGKSKTKGKLDSFPRILERSQKIFYVCCTRTKENLAVFYYDPSPEVITQAEKWFGGNVTDLAMI